MSIEYETEDHVARITINRPRAMNAIDRAHNGALEEAWRRLNEDPQIRVGVLTGAGEHAFCAGADLKELIPSHHRAVRAGERTPWTMGGITLEPHYGKPDDRRGQRPRTRRRHGTGARLRHTALLTECNVRACRDQVGAHSRRRRNAALAAPGAARVGDGDDSLGRTYRRANGTQHRVGQSRAAERAIARKLPCGSPRRLRNAARSPSGPRGVRFSKG